MAPLSLTQWCINLRRRKPPPLSMLPICLACVTSFLILLYMSYTFDNFFHLTKIFPADTPSLVKLPKQNDSISDVLVTFEDQNGPPITRILDKTHDHYKPGGNYASEAYLKNVLFKSHFVTNDPSEADLFFLPFSIASLRHDRKIGVSGLSDFILNYVTNIIQNYPYWNRTGGADHFYAACHSIGRVAMEKVDQVKSNAIQVVCSSSYFLTNYFAHKDVSLPQIWPRHEEPLDLASHSKRKKLAFYAGTANSPLRKAVVQTWENDSSIFVHGGRLKTPYSEQLLGSKYCLHVKGFEVNTARVGDAFYYGCVPVILADYYDLPFMDIINWKSFSVVITSSDIPNLKKILLSISPKRYSVLQANVLKVRKHFQWNNSPLDFDAFYMVMYELWLRRSTIRVMY
uniref:Exostosin GT47 domain-containing protein n=1 Tax=Chenopodium quinoa TaxID=63459 RepID=A0A803MWC3_CHEQI